MIGLLEAAGYAIVAGAAADIAVGLAGRWRRSRLARRSVAAEASLFARHAELSLRRAELERDRAVNAWSGYRKLTVARKIPEADDVHSFELAAHDGRSLPGFLPGQFLTFQIRIPGRPKPLVRCYSLSDAPGRNDRYRITVKKIGRSRQGGEPPDAVSAYFNDVLQEGDILDVRAPAGSFHCDPAADDPLVLIAGGIGITPLLSMLNAATAEPSDREIWLFYGVRDRRQHAFARHLGDLCRLRPNIRLVTCYSQPTADCVSGRDYDRTGHIDRALLNSYLPSNNYTFYLCGPAPMMDVLSADLRDWGVPAGQIRTEAFGAATVRRQLPAGPRPAVAGDAQIVFARAGRTLSWDPACGTILELAERNGITIESGCRAGHCGTCAVAIKDGVADYVAQPVITPEPGTCLACIAVPAGRLVLDG